VYEGRGLHGHIVELIGARIVSGQHPVGATLFAGDLEDEFGVSKTVVREALKVLAAKGLVESRQKRGTIVRPRSAWRLLDPDVVRWRDGGKPDYGFLESLAEVRQIVEPAAAQLAATRRDERDLALLETALEAMSSSGDDAEKIVAADLMFHRALLAAAHNELLTEMEVVLSSGLQVRDRFVHHSTNWSDSVPTHRAVLDAIRGHDADAARRGVEQLLDQAASDLAAARQEAETPARGTRRPPPVDDEPARAARRASRA
jgi:GntR family transcriptional regulator, galactonate operon transcriptional repressor